jgi:hypothetical protein
MFKKLAVAAGIAASLGLASGLAQAQVYPDFTVDQNKTGLTSGPGTFVADKGIGGYVEVIDFVQTTGNAVNGTGTFTFSLRWDIDSWYSNNGSTSIDSEVSGLGINHDLYALLTGSGSFTTVNGVTTFNTAAGLGSLELWYDDLNNTQFTNTNAPAPNPTPITDQASLFVRTGTADDSQLLASAIVLGGTGTLDPTLQTCQGGGINCGSFGQTTRIALNANGSQYFTAPVPFYELAFNSGQLNNFSVSGRQIINGSADLVFGRLPEPSALALVGIALVGLSMTRRRRQG